MIRLRWQKFYGLSDVIVHYKHIIHERRDLNLVNEMFGGWRYDWKSLPKMEKKTKSSEKYWNFTHSEGTCKWNTWTRTIFPRALAYSTIASLPFQMEILFGSSRSSSDRFSPVNTKPRQMDHPTHLRCLSHQREPQQNEQSNRLRRRNVSVYPHFHFSWKTGFF